MKAYARKLRTFFTSILKRKRCLKLAPAYIVGDEFNSGEVTHKEYTSYEAAIQTMKRAAAEGRVIWPAPTSRRGWRKARPGLKRSLEADKRYLVRCGRDEDRERALKMFGKDYL